MKDEALPATGFRALLEAELQKVKEAGGNRSTSLINQQLHALYRASTVALKVSSGEEGTPRDRRIGALVSLKSATQQGSSCWWRVRVSSVILKKL